MIRMILAVDSGSAIGWKDGRLPWKIPTDMKRFKELTTGSTVVMGWSTYKSLGRADGLPNRKNLVLTRRPYSEIRGQFGNVDIISSLDYVKRLNEHCTMGMGCESAGACFAEVHDTPEQCPLNQDIWIIGGASVYDQALDAGLVDEIYLTLVDETSGADVCMKYDMAAWKTFMLQQQKQGIIWNAELEYPHVESGPSITYVTMRKFK